MPENSSCIAFNLRDRLKIVTMCHFMKSSTFEPSLKVWTPSIHPLGCKRMQMWAILVTLSCKMQRLHGFHYGKLAAKVSSVSLLGLNGQIYLKYSVCRKNSGFLSHQWIGEHFSLLRFTGEFPYWGNVEYYRNWCWFSFKKTVYMDEICCVLPALSVNWSFHYFQDWLI